MRTSGHCVSTFGAAGLGAKAVGDGVPYAQRRKFRLLSGLCWAVTSTLKLWRG